MLPKIEELIRTYTIKIGAITKELRGLTKNSHYETRLTLLKKQGVYIDVVKDLRDMIK